MRRHPHVALRAAVAALLVLAQTGLALAETHEVRMLNKGPGGQRNVFDPPVIQVRPGDTVRFVPVDRGHNSASIDDMLPAGASGWRGDVGRPVEVTFEVEGAYGYRCEPHFGFGMVGLVLVGNAGEGLAAVRGATPRGPAGRAFETLFSEAEALSAR